MQLGINRSEFNEKNQKIIQNKYKIQTKKIELQQNSTIMDQFKKSYSFQDNQNENDEYNISKSGLYQSQTFSCGLNTYDSFQNFSEIKSSIDQVTKQETIQEEVSDKCNY